MVTMPPDHEQGAEDLAVDLADEETRRSLMKKTAVGALSAGSIAGCLGGDDGSDGSSSTQRTVDVAAQPGGFMGIILDRIQDSGVLDQVFQANDLDANVTQTWEDAAIFTAGGADISPFSSMEAATMGAERDIALACNARIAPNQFLLVTRRGSPYDPEVAGGAEAAIDKIHEDQTPVGFGGWGGGIAPALSIMFDAAFGYTFVSDEEQSDIPYATADWAAVPQLVNDGEFDIGVTAPLFGAAPYMTGDDPSLAKVVSIGEEVSNAGIGVPQLNDWICSQEFADEWPAGIASMVQAYYEGVEWFTSNPVEIIESDEEYLTQIGAENAEQARFAIEWGINLSNPGPWENDIPALYSDVELTDEFIEADRAFLTRASEGGFLDGNWSDHLTYRKVDQQGDEDYTVE